MFKAQAGQTLTNVKKLGWVFFGDFTLKIIGEITSTGSWMCLFASQVLGRCVERYGIALKVMFTSFDLY